MNEIISAFLLLSVPGLPLLLAFPALHSRLPGSAYIALLPAIIIVLIPESATIEIPWLLLGITLDVNEVSKLLLIMSVVLWAASAALLPTADNDSSGRRVMTYFLLTLTGNLGTILAADLISFFVFLTLTSYGFYALLVSEGEDTRQSGRIYLSFMIIADLVLFEALLIAAATSNNLEFEAMRHAMSQSSSSNMYLSMVLIGFALKAGFWPLHFWLAPVFRSSRPAVAILLGGVPVASGILGTIRWLPLGEITSPELGLIVQILGIAAIIYAFLSGLIRAQVKMLPVYILIIISGFYVTFLGIALSNPAVWTQYKDLVYGFIVTLGIGFAVLVMVTYRLESKYGYRITPEKQSNYLSQVFKSPWLIKIRQLISRIKFEQLYQKITIMDFLRQKQLWLKMLDYSAYSLQRWSIAIILFLLLGIAIVFIGAASLI